MREHISLIREKYTLKTGMISSAKTRTRYTELMAELFLGQAANTLHY